MAAKKRVGSRVKGEAADVIKRDGILHRRTRSGDIPIGIRRTPAINSKLHAMGKKVAKKFNIKPRKRK